MKIHKNAPVFLLIVSILCFNVPNASVLAFSNNNNQPHDRGDHYRGWPISTPTLSSTPTPTITPTPTVKPTMTIIPTVTPTPPHQTVQGSASSTPTITPTPSSTPTTTSTPTLTSTPTPTVISTPTSTPIATTTPILGDDEDQIPVCSEQSTRTDIAQCYSRVVVNKFTRKAKAVDVDENGFAIQSLLEKNTPKANVVFVPKGLGPNDLHTAYNIATSSHSNKQIIAIIDAYNYPTVLNDLNIYSKQYGIPQMKLCSGSIASSSVTCLSKMNQTGSTSSFPTFDENWALETILDIEMAHATCQDCKILVVEARSPSYYDLLAAVDQAVKQGATVISNSYGTVEFQGEQDFDTHFNHPGIGMIVSAGDSGFGSGYPASSPYVTAVGGTSLTFSSTTKAWNETTWAGTSSGCSLYEPKPTWQKDTGCLNRTMNDVSAVADPSTGVAVYDSAGFGGQKGWFVIGGTSVSAPIIAGVYALAGGVPAGKVGASLPYLQNPKTNLHDITTGNNGSCSNSYLCTAKAGYDGPTGLGTPKGLGAF